MTSQAFYFRREAELIATIMAAGKMYLPGLFSSLQAATTAEPAQGLITEADHRTKLQHFIHVRLGTIHKSQEVRNTVCRAPASDLSHGDFWHQPFSVQYGFYGAGGTAYCVPDFLRLMDGA